jgi:hypothetical protein
VAIDTKIEEGFPMIVVLRFQFQFYLSCASLFLSYNSPHFLVPLIIEFPMLLHVAMPSISNPNLKHVQSNRCSDKYLMSLWLKMCFSISLPVLSNIGYGGAVAFSGG